MRKKTHFLQIISLKMLINKIRYEIIALICHNRFIELILTQTTLLARGGGGLLTTVPVLKSFCGTERYFHLQASLYAQRPFRRSFRISYSSTRVGIDIPSTCLVMYSYQTAMVSTLRTQECVDSMILWADSCDFPST